MIQFFNVWLESLTYKFNYQIYIISKMATSAKPTNPDITSKQKSCIF